MFVRIRWIFLRCSARILYTRGILYTQTDRDRVWITIQGFTSCHESSWLSFWNFWHLPVTERKERRRGVKDRGGGCWRAREILRLLIWIANGRNDSLCPRPTGWSFSAKRRWNLPVLPSVFLCVRASSLLSSSLLSLVIRRSPPGSVRATEKFS